MYIVDNEVVMCDNDVATCDNDVSKCDDDVSKGDDTNYHEVLSLVDDINLVL